MKKLSGGVRRSIGYGALVLALLLLMLMGGAAWAQPAVNCNGDDCTYTLNGKTQSFNRRGKFDAVIGANNQKMTVDQTFSLILANGYGDVYFLNKLRDRSSYVVYRGYVTYKGFSLSGCSTTGDVVLLRITATPAMPEYYSLMSTSWRWGTTMYVLNDVFRPLSTSVYAGYENWYPFDMTCSVAMYILYGGW